MVTRTFRMNPGGADVQRAQYSHCMKVKKGPLHEIVGGYSTTPQRARSKFTANVTQLTEAGVRPT